MIRTAIIRGQTVENITLLDPDSDWTPGLGLEAVECPPEVQIGWGYDGQNFIEPEPAPSEPVRVSKADFQRLLTATERYALNALRKQIAALPPEEYGDPANALLVAAEDVIFAFEQPLEFIELDHPDTAQGLSLLAYLDVIEPERIAEIVVNRPLA